MVPSKTGRPADFKNSFCFRHLDGRFIKLHCRGTAIGKKIYKWDKEALEEKIGRINPFESTTSALLPNPSVT